ncbi:MAG: MarR family winged helix-turn-helix transcriptional regulator [Chitinophagaceae bacterium]
MKKDTVEKIRQFNRFYTKIIGVTNNHILESQYSLSEVRVMYEIHHYPAITARQIMQMVQVDEGYLSRLIAKLVKQKIISKIKSTDDSRASSLTLTKKGTDIFLNLSQRSSDAVVGIIQHLDNKEQAELIQLFNKIENLLTKNISNDNG